MKKYILFDNDGVLVETERLYYKASKCALKEFFNYDISFEQYMKVMTDGNGIWVVVPNASKKEVITARNQRDIYYQEYLKTEKLEINGVVEVLEELSKSYKMGIITTSRRVDFDLIHTHRPIIQFMDFTLCVEEYPRAKPYPDPYLAGMKKFNATQEECIIVEDSQRGLISAVAAGIDCVIVDNEFTRSQDFTDAQYFIKNLKQLPELLQSI